MNQRLSKETLGQQIQANQKHIGGGHRSKMKTRRRRCKRTVITQRDLKVLQFLFEHKFVSRDQIRSYFFTGTHRSIVNDRLKKILDFGLVRRTPIEKDQKIIYGYRLTLEGLNRVKTFMPYITHGKVNKSYAYLHDMALVDIRKAFENRHSVKSYYTENVLQSCSEFQEEYQAFLDLNSDGMTLVETKIGTLKLAIEFDSSTKSKERYRKKVDAYYWEQKVHGVLYICKNSYILNVLHKIDQEISQKHQCSSKMYFALLNDITTDKEELIFRDINSYVFKIS